MMFLKGKATTGISPLARALGLSAASLFLLIQACPNPEFIQGYLGNLGTEGGNCPTTPDALPPLDAFGSLTINQNGPLQSVNRLNSSQLPTTNNFQLFQNPCAIDSTLTWTSSSIDGIPSTTSGGILRTRSGPFFIGMARTGPTASVAQFNFNLNANNPNLQANFVNTLPNQATSGFSNTMTLFFSATETNEATSANYFDICCQVINSETCVVKYLPINGAPGLIQDYNLTGNIFHDVYYENLTPALALNNKLVSGGLGVFLSVDGGPVKQVAFDSHVTGKSFQFFANRYSPLGPFTMVLYAVDAADTGITFKLQKDANDYFIFTAVTPYTGFLRLAPISTNDAEPITGAHWSQISYYMPEDICNPADTSIPNPNPAPCGTGTVGSVISPCAIEDPACPLTPTTQNWWALAQVSAIAPTGMSFYMLFPTVWANSFAQLANKVMGAHWIIPGAGNILIPTSQALSDILPAIAMGNTTLSNTYYNDFFTLLNPTGMPPYTDGSNFSANFFLVQFDMFLAQNLRSDISAFQTASRTIPTYTITPPDNVAIYTAHRLQIPIQADIFTTATTVTWAYTASPQVPPPGTFTPLMCFPFWKQLQGQAPQNFIFNDTIKGTFYAAEGIDGAVTFGEGGIPTWYGAPSYFIPNTLGASWTAGQKTALGTALTQIQQENHPLPTFPDSFLDSAYNGLKTCYMLAKSGLYIAYYMAQTGSSSAAIIAQTQPFIDNAKSALNAFLLGRTPGANFFIGDRTGAGICTNGAGEDGTYAQGPNLQQYQETGSDFGNYVYNDHHFFAGYFLVAAAMIIEWELQYSSAPLWIDLAVTGGDGQSYKVRDMVDFIWRDTHNPFKNQPTVAQPIYDPDLPYDRYGFPWEGHSVANGLQYQPNSLGRSQESISEDFNSWVGMNTFSNMVLKANTAGKLAPALTAIELAKYQTAADFSIMNIKLTATGGIQWYKNPTYWKGVSMYLTDPTSLSPSMFIGQFTQATVTNGQINDVSQQNQAQF